MVAETSANTLFTAFPLANHPPHQTPPARRVPALHKRHLPNVISGKKRRWLSAGPTAHNQPFTLANSKHGTSLCGSKSGTAKCKMRFCRNFPPLNIIKKPWMFCHWELPVGKQRGTCIQMVNKIKNRVAGIKLEMNSPFSMRSRKR